MSSRVKIDSIDWKILKALADDGRITKTNLSEAVALSPSPCHERMRRLEAAGVIKGYAADIDFSALGSFVYFMTTIKITDYEFSQVKAFERDCLAEPSVVEFMSVLGETDYIMKTATRDLAEYQDVVSRLFKSQKFVVHYVTHPISKMLKPFDPAGLFDRCKPSRAR